MRANLEAWHSDLKADAGEGFAIYPDHNLHMLLYAASMDGQGARRDRRPARTTPSAPATRCTRCSRWSASAASTRSSRSPSAPSARFPAAAFDFSQGYAKLKLGEPEFAKAYLAKVKKVADTSKQEFRNHPAARLVGVLAGILDGEITRMAGDVPGAIAKFETAVKLDDEMEYDEPEPLPFPARHWLGAALLEAKRFADAEAVYREDLEQHPHNGWSLLGLQQALKAQGKTDPAVDADLAKSWSRSDTWIRASRF